jgi:PTH1 family peptidyl-tRNA hydrolase
VWAVIGLGNPGKRYSQTRHNVGFTLIKRLAKYWGIRLRKRKYLSKAADVERGREKVLLAMPQTFMNRSGLAAKRIVDDGGILPERLVVVFDDFDLPLGEIRIREKGTAGSHKGMHSILQELKSTRIPRVRIGIGPVKEGMDAVDFVLSPFRKEESQLLEKGLAKAREAVELVLSGEIQKAMNLYNERMEIAENMGETS